MEAGMRRAGSFPPVFEVVGAEDGRPLGPELVDSLKGT